MVLANCIKCGALYNKTVNELCPKCVEEEENLLSETQDYLRRNRNAGYYDVVDALDLDTSLVDKWIEQQRINLKSPDDVWEEKHENMRKRQQRQEELKRFLHGPKKDDASSSGPDEDKPKKSGMHYRRED